MATLRCRQEEHPVGQPKNERYDSAPGSRPAQSVTGLRRHSAGCTDVRTQCECSGGTRGPPDLLEETKGCSNPYSDSPGQESVCSGRGGAFNLKADQAERDHKRCRPLPCYL